MLLLNSDIYVHDFVVFPIQSVYSNVRCAVYVLVLNAAIATVDVIQYKFIVQ